MMTRSFKILKLEMYADLLASTYPKYVELKIIIIIFHLKKKHDLKTEYNSQIVL